MYAKKKRVTGGGGVQDAQDVRTNTVMFQIILGH